MKFSIDIPKNKFDQHLALEGNQRIIFSAPFGVGKTYFLTNYFEDNPAYEVIHLYPVNYSVASNEDIFELIKYDILFELFGKEVTFDKLEISHIESLLKFAAKNGHHILAPFLMLVPELGKSMYSIYDKLQKLSETYLKEHDEQQVDDKKTAIDYLQGFTKQKGNIYEEDFYTQLIVQLVEQLKNKGKEGTKETVLVIDDLDRVDPDHIFRIFNVLSAHLNKNESENKFNFDRIILVCDIKNIHKIFQNRYGADVDFSGYIDKFYSHKVFDFENADGLTEQIWKIIQSIERPDDNRWLNVHNGETVFARNIAYVLISLIKANKLSVRRIVKITGGKFLRKSYTPNFGNFRHNYSNMSLEIIYLFEYLFQFFDTWDDLIGALEHCEEFETQFFYREARENFIGFALVALDARTHKLKIDPKGGVKIFHHESSSQSVFYKGQRLHDSRNSYYCAVEKITYYRNQEENDSYEYFPVLVDTAKKLKELNTIQLP